MASDEACHCTCTVWDAYHLLVSGSVDEATSETVGAPDTILSKPVYTDPNIAAVALANKNARTIWALLAHDREYEASYKMAA